MTTVLLFLLFEWLVTYDPSNITKQARRPSWSTSGKSERLLLAVRWPEQPPTLQPQAAPVIDAQSWTPLFRAISSHQQPSAYLTKGIPQLDKPHGQTGQT